MKFKKVIATVFVKEFNTTALILEDDAVVKLWHSKYYNVDEHWFEAHVNLETEEPYKDFE